MPVHSEQLAGVNELSSLVLVISDSLQTPAVYIRGLTGSQDSLHIEKNTACVVKVNFFTMLTYTEMNKGLF